MLEKQAIRDRIREQRRNLEPSVLAYKSHCITLQALELIRRVGARNIAVFASLPGEPDTTELIREILSLNGFLFLPRVERKNLTFYRVFDPLNQLLSVPPYGIREPVPDRCEVANLQSLDLVFTPGLAFDVDGNRLGQGAGFYDRFFAAFPTPLPIRVGLAFEFQMYRTIPHRESDVAIDGIITEERFFRPRHSAIITNSPEETRRLGEQLANRLAFNTILGLQGPLGSGKTVLVQGLARGFGVAEDIVSQTFTLAKEYRTSKGALWHVDLYRLTSESEIDMGFWSEILEGPGLKAIEWSERLGDHLPLDAVIAEATVTGENRRTWSLATPLNSQWDMHDLLRDFRHIES
ncbi:MAG TPA: 5-formyltetrahydrofolate cyclo-ligase [bacterium]|nr:5-formyltetrahydrofolate cyclo-ligase [bacterium]HPO08401.1 5-formyltetrahydrofolate cyclo-ligase [bacterium]